MPIPPGRKRSAAEKRRRDLNTPGKEEMPTLALGRRRR